MIGIYLSIKYFQHLIKSRQVSVYTDHLCSLNKLGQIYSKSNSAHWVHFTIHFKHDMHHVKCAQNGLADVLFCQHMKIKLNIIIDVKQMTIVQENNPELVWLKSSPLSLVRSDMHYCMSDSRIVCDESTDVPGDHVPPSYMYRCIVFDFIESLSYPGIHVHVHVPNKFLIPEIGYKHAYSARGRKCSDTLSLHFLASQHLALGLTIFFHFCGSCGTILYIPLDLSGPL